LGLPFISEEHAPIQFLGVGKLEVGFGLVKALMEDGVYPCLACYPSVPYNNTGLRCMITIHHTERDIDFLLERMAVRLPQILSKENFSREQIDRAFNLNSSREETIALPDHS
jgi:hypothetical protein